MERRNSTAGAELFIAPVNPILAGGLLLLSYRYIVEIQISVSWFTIFQELMYISVLIHR